MQALSPTRHRHTAVYQVFPGTSLCFCVPARDLMLILGWPKSAFGFFYNIVWETSNGLFGQPNTANVCFVVGLQGAAPRTPRLPGQLVQRIRGSGPVRISTTGRAQYAAYCCYTKGYRVKLTASAFCFFFFNFLNKS